MSKKETIESLIREMRDLAKSHCSEDGMDCTDALELIPIDEFADRIEAAWNRERVAIEADALNAGALVEAFRRQDETKMKCKNKEEPCKLDDWEWDTLVGAWRYYEHRSSITASMFPAEIVSRYWGGNWDAEDRYRIARQFAIVDHSRKGIDDWATDDAETLPWRKFYAFCKACCYGFKTLKVLDDDGVFYQLKSFFCDGRWYCVDEYIANPMRDIYINYSRIERDQK